MASILARLAKVKADPACLFDSRTVERACRRVGHVWRERTLDPTTTLRAFALQIAEGNTSIAHVVRLAGGGFSESAYCQARSRVPVAVIEDLFERSARGSGDESEGTWCGRRVAIMDGSGVSVPDTHELRAWFGVRGGCAPDCGLPLMSVLTVFNAANGRLLALKAAPAATQDLHQAYDLHPALNEGDVVVGDRGLCAYVHLALLREIGCDGVFRVSKARAMPFPARRGERTRNSYNRHRRHEPILVELISENDQVVEIVKPHNRPKHMSPETFARIPGKMVVRAVRYTTRGRGVRAREITLLTTLTDARAYPADALAELYLMRWRIEVNLRHLKRTMGMERLKCRSVDGVMRELLMFALIYNAVCRLRSAAAARAGLEPVRLSFVDALRALLHGIPGSAPAIKVWPLRPPRVQPRQLKHSHSQFPVMNQPRRKLIQWIEQQEAAHN